MKVICEVLAEVRNIIKHNKCCSRFRHKLKTKKYKSYWTYKIVIIAKKISVL